MVCRRLCRQHAKVKLDKASQFVPADVAHCIRFNSAVLMGTPQQALLKAYDEQNSSEVLPPPRKSKRLLLFNSERGCPICGILFSFAQ